MRTTHRLVPTLLVLAAIALAVAGVDAWRMFSTPPECPPHVFCGAPPPPHRLHPLRAELLWAASAACAILAIGLAAWRRPMRSAAV